MKVHFSSDSNEWATPKSLFDILDEEFLFTLDPCATKDNAKCSNFYTKEDEKLWIKRMRDLGFEGELFTLY